MDNVLDNKTIFRNIVERDIENVYASTRQFVLSVIPQQFGIIAKQYIKMNEPTWIEKMQALADLLVETSFVNPETTLEDAIANSNSVINGMLSEWIHKNIGLPSDTVSLILNHMPDVL